MTSSALWLTRILICIIPTAVSVQEWTLNLSDSSPFATPFYHFWDQSVGSGHAALMLREDWQQWMQHGVDRIDFRYVRAHGILNDDVGSVKNNDPTQYSFVNVDKIYSRLVSMKLKPFVELSFMPDTMASGTETICHYKGNKTPPKDYEIWGNYITQLVQHLVDVFGIDEVSTWFFEVWNEPFGKTFWTGTPEQYYRLYNYTALAVKSVSDRLQVGGPALCCVNPADLDAFLNFTFAHKLPIDFVSWHSYSNTKLSLSSWVATNVVPLQNVVASHNASLPVYVTEWSSACCAPQTGYDDEYNAAYLIYVAKYFQDTIYSEQQDSMIKWMSYWSISDVFEEGGFNSNEFNGLYGLQTIRGIPKPAFRAMELLHEYGGNVSYTAQLLSGGNANDTVIVYGLKQMQSSNRYAVFVANFNSQQLPIEEHDLSIYVHNEAEYSLLETVVMYRIDANHTNPIVAWKNMNSPLYPSQQQLQTINASSQLVAMQNVPWKQVNTTTVRIDFTIPIHGVALLDIQYS